MIQSGDRPGLTIQSLTMFGFRRERCREDLDGDDPIQARILGSIHLAHATGAERRQYLVGSEIAARSDCHGAARL